MGEENLWRIATCIDLRSHGDLERCSSTCSIDQQPHSHTDVATKRVNCTDVVTQNDVASLQYSFLLLFFFQSSSLNSLCPYSVAFVWLVCDQASVRNGSCNFLLTCNCVKRAALSICNVEPHQCLMQSLSLLHFSPSLHPPPRLWKQPCIFYWSIIGC